MGTYIERPACSQLCPGCHVLPSKDGTSNFTVTCDSAKEPKDSYIGVIPPLTDSDDPDIGLIVELACLTPEKRMRPV